MKKEKLQQTTQKYKKRQTTMRNYVGINCTAWKKAKKS